MRIETEGVRADPESARRLITMYYAPYGPVLERHLQYTGWTYNMARYALALEKLASASSREVASQAVYLYLRAHPHIWTHSLRYIAKKWHPGIARRLADVIVDRLYEHLAHEEPIDPDFFEQLPDDLPEETICNVGRKAYPLAP